MQMRPDSDEQGFTLVELLVSMAILAVIAGAITTLTVTSLRVESTQRELRAVQSDARISLENMRREMREARRVFTDSCASVSAGGCVPDASGDFVPSRQAYFWLDDNQNNIVEAPELVCYYTAEITSGSGQYRLWRTENPSSCDAVTLEGSPPSDARILAQTLTTPTPFTDMDPSPTDIATDPETRSIEITLDLEVLGNQFDRTTTFVNRVRLRNVA